MSRSTPIRRRMLAGLVVRVIVPPLVLLMFTAPVMACMMEAATLSVSESACCRQMHGDCHNSVGPVSHKCCRTFAGAADASAPGKSLSLQPDAVPFSVPEVAPLVVAGETRVYVSASPPGSPPVSSSVLRI